MNLNFNVDSDIRKAETLPAIFYKDPELFEIIKKKIFLRTWHWIGDENLILETISPEKDVDGFHKVNVGAMVTGNAKFYPCTPHGIMMLLDFYGIPIEGQHAVVIGRSNIVGKPMALMLLEKGATVSICTSKTADLSMFTRQADIVVVAVGKPNMLEASMIKKGAAVIDVGINRLENGSLVGDVDYQSALTVAGFLTPVPGGVGPMTITMLLENTIRSSEMSRC